MKLSIVNKTFSSIGRWLQEPHKVFFLCLAMIFVSLVVEGSLLSLWRLHQEANSLQVRINEVIEVSKTLNMKIKKASKLNYIDQQARDRFDLVGKDDLIFVFSDEKN